MEPVVRRAVRLVLLSSLLVAGCGAPPVGRPTAVLPRQPNVLLIVADDHAYQALSAYGSGLNETPNLDRIAAEGIRFDRTLVTNSICAPSRAVILTGVYSHVNGVLDNSLEFDGGQETFPKRLQAAGYETAAFGKWHLKSEPTGFERWEVLPGQGHYYNPDLRTPEGTVRREGYVSEVVTDLALDWLATERDAERPFFLWLGHKAPHRNWMPGPDYLDTYAQKEFPEPPTLFDDYSGRASPASAQEMEIDRHMTLLYDLKVAPAVPETQEWEVSFWDGMRARMSADQLARWRAYYEPRNEAFHAAGLDGADLVRWKYQEYLRDYLRTIASIDDNVGRVLDYLDDSGLAAETLVVYVSDQGFYLGEHGWYDKRWIYEESLRTPMLMRWPGVIEPGTTDAHLTSNLDLAPTVLAAAGLAADLRMQGASLLPLMQGRAPAAWRDSFYYHYYEADGPHAVAEHYGVVTDRHKLVRYPATDEWELFDRRDDPHELRSRHEEPGLAPVRAELASELDRLRAELGIEP